VRSTRQVWPVRSTASAAKFLTCFLLRVLAGKAGASVCDWAGTRCGHGMLSVCFIAAHRQSAPGKCVEV